MTQTRTGYHTDGYRTFKPFAHLKHERWRRLEAKENIYQEHEHNFKDKVYALGDNRFRIKSTCLLCGLVEYRIIHGKLFYIGNYPCIFFSSPFKDVLDNKHTQEIEIPADTQETTP